MTDTKKDKTEKNAKKGAAWLDNFDDFQNVSLETSLLKIMAHTGATVQKA